MSRTLITGALGFAGRVLVDRLAQQGDEVYGAYLESEGVAGDDPIRRQLQLVPMDVLHEERISAVLAEIQPERIYHLAAVVPIHHSLNSPARVMQVNAIGTVNLLEAVRKSGLRPRILVPGSSEEFGLIHPGEVPVTEDQPLRPTNPYGVSKAAQTLLALQYFRSYKLPVISARPFNMTGPGQTPDYACPAFARQIARIEAGLSEPVLMVGTLTARRDYSDVRDIMRACAGLMDRAHPGESYNLCSGQAVNMQEILDRMLAMSSARIEVRPDPSRMRPAENELVVGSNRKLIEATDYAPQFTLEQTLRDVLAYWRGRISAGGEVFSPHYPPAVAAAKPGSS